MIWIIMAVYQVAVLLVDFVYLFFQCIFLFFVSIYRFFDPPKQKSVAGETVLITGTGHGIGKEIAIQFARLGAKVVCLDINEEWNRSTVTQITKEGGSAWAFWCDVSKHDEIKAVSDKIRRVIGDVTILVNNAGIMPCKPFGQYTQQDIERTFTVNVYSHFWTLMEWLPVFKENGRGHVVAVSSMCGVMGTPYLAPYCSSKFAVTGLMEGLSEELRYGYQYPNIKLTRVHPYTTDTGLAQNPRMRFPSINPLVSPEECARLIIQSVRREDEVAFIPYKEYYVHKFIMALPRQIQHAVLDFADTGVDPHDSTE